MALRLTKVITPVAVASMLLVSAGGAVFAKPGSSDILGFDAVSGGTLNEYRARGKDIKFKPDEVVVKYKGQKRFHKVRLGKGEHVAKAIKRLRQDPAVESAEPNFLAQAQMIPNDPYYPLQWHLDNQAGSGHIGVAAAWDAATGAGVTVAVVDTGIAYEDNGNFRLAPDLASTCFVPGYDFVNDDTHPNDDNSHGTHVAGTIAQSTNNSRGVAGVAFGSCLMPVKVLDRNGSGSYTDVADGIRFAVDNGAKVINLSLGGPVPASYLEDAVAYAHGRGVTIVAAAGNDGAENIIYPAAYDAYVIAVGATRYDEQKAYYANFGPGLDVVAPGGDLRVDQNRDGYGDGVLQNTFNPNTKNVTDFSYWFFQGTSMATPHVAGIAALVIGNGAVTTPDDVRAALETTAKDLGTAGWDENFGWGLVNAPAALAYAPGPVDAPPTVNLTSPIPGDTVSGMVLFTADAGDDAGVSRVDFSVDGAVVGSDAAAPYELSWDSTSGADGFRTVQATAVDTADQTTTDSAAVLVDNVNDAPVADAGSDQTVGDPDGDGSATVALSASGSSDPDGDIVTYLWTEEGETLGAGEALDASFTVGAHLVILTVTDDRGASDTDEVAITVNPNQPPVAHAGADLVAGVGQEVALNGTGSSDPDGSLVSYLWDFGDGSYGSGGTVSHAYAAAGTFTVTLTVTDNGGLTAVDSAVVTVTEAPPTVAVFTDSFEVAEWNNLWTEDAQNDWSRSSLRSSDGAWSAQVAGYASGARLISVPINLQGKTNATISFAWYLAGDVDAGENLKFEVSTNGGASWTEKARLRGDQDVEDTWHTVNLELTNISQLRLRFRGKMSLPSETGNVDNVQVLAW